MRIILGILSVILLISGIISGRVLIENRVERKELRNRLGIVSGIGILFGGILISAIIML